MWVCEGHHGIWWQDGDLQCLLDPSKLVKWYQPVANKMELWIIMEKPVLLAKGLRDQSSTHVSLWRVSWYLVAGRRLTMPSRPQQAWKWYQPVANKMELWIIMEKPILRKNDEKIRLVQRTWVHDHCNNNRLYSRDLRSLLDPEKLIQ